MTKRSIQAGMLLLAAFFLGFIVKNHAELFPNRFAEWTREGEQVFCGFIEIELSPDEEILSLGDTFRYLDMETPGDRRKKVDSYVHEVSVQLTDPLPKYESQEQMCNYFLERHPDAERYEVYPAKDGEDYRFYEVYEPLTLYGYFAYEGKSYEIKEQVGEGPSIVNRLSMCYCDNPLLFTRNKYSICLFQSEFANQEKFRMISAFPIFEKPFGYPVVPWF